MEDDKFIGLDSGLIDRIYFPTAVEKSEYLSEVQKVLRDLSIKLGNDRLDVINKVADADVDFPFLSDILAFTEDLQYSKNSDTNNYYTNCKLCEYNVRKKLETGMNDFRDEEALFYSLMLIELTGYARLNLTFEMGQAFARLELWEKADYYFSLLRDTLFDISPATVSEFYKAIAQVYLDSNTKDIALSWLKAGILLNPKLAVKKVIKQLEAN
jgi:hypothetical protein